MPLARVTSNDIFRTCVPSAEETTYEAFLELKNTVLTLFLAAGGIVQETFVSMFDYRDIKNPQHFDAWAQRLHFTPTQCSGPITVFSTVWSHIRH